MVTFKKIYLIFKQEEFNANGHAHQVLVFYDLNTWSLHLNWRYLQGSHKESPIHLSKRFISSYLIVTECFYIPNSWQQRQQPCLSETSNILQIRVRPSFPHSYWCMQFKKWWMVRLVHFSFYLIPQNKQGRKWEIEGI